MSYLSLKVIEHVCVHCGVCVCVLVWILGWLFLLFSISRKRQNKHVWDA